MHFHENASDQTDIVANYQRTVARLPRRAIFNNTYLDIAIIDLSKSSIELLFTFRLYLLPLLSNIRTVETSKARGSLVKCEFYAATWALVSMKSLKANSQCKQDRRNRLNKSVYYTPASVGSNQMRLKRRCVGQVQKWTICDPVNHCRSMVVCLLIVFVADIVYSREFFLEKFFSRKNTREFFLENFLRKMRKFRFFK